MNPFYFAFGTLVAVGVLGGIFSWLGSDIAPKTDWQDQFWPRLQTLFVFAVLIERSVEVYLNAIGGNGDDRFKAQTGTIKEHDASKTAAIASIILGILVAFAGIRLMNTLGDVGTNTSDLTKVIWYGSDIIVSAGLMAGGSALFHELAEAIRGGLTNLGRATSGVKAQPAAMDAAADVTTFRIEVNRSGADTGTVSFSGAGVTVNTTCWWDPQRKIDSGVYRDCSKTRMATKKDSSTGENRPGVFLPSAVAPDTGNNTIFLHEGKDPSWSDGCIVLDRDQMMTIWNAISPSDARNVTVTIKDV